VEIGPSHTAVKIFDQISPNGQVLPMMGNFIFVRPELLPGFLSIRSYSSASIETLVGGSVYFGWLSTHFFIVTMKPYPFCSLP